MSSTAAITARVHREGKKAQANATVSMSPVRSTTNWQKDPCRLRSELRLAGGTRRPYAHNRRILWPLGESRQLIDVLPAHGLQRPDGRSVRGDRPQPTQRPNQNLSVVANVARRAGRQTGVSLAALTELYRRSMYSKETVCLRNPDAGVRQCCLSSGRPQVSHSAQYFGRE